MALLQRRKAASLGWGKKAPGQQLSHAAKLSCIAGSLEGQAQKKHSAQLAALRPPSNAAQAKAEGKPTHSKLKPATRKVAQPSKLLELAEKEHKASDEAAGKAGWRAGGRAHLPASYRAGNAREMHNWIRATTEPSMKLMQKTETYH